MSEITSKDAVDDRDEAMIESLEIMNDKEFIASYRKAKQQTRD
jgi:hypothetical protein